MIAPHTHLDDLAAVLQSSSGIRLSTCSPDQLRDYIANALTSVNPHLAERLRDLDEWGTDALADFVTEAKHLAEAWDRSLSANKDGTGETRVG